MSSSTLCVPVFSLTFKVSSYVFFVLFYDISNDHDACYQGLSKMTTQRSLCLTRRRTGKSHPTGPPGHPRCIPPSQCTPLSSYVCSAWGSATKTGFWDKGKQEIDVFQKKHKCNTVCQALGLNWDDDDNDDESPLQGLGRGGKARNVMAVENLVNKSAKGKGKAKVGPRDGTSAMTSIMVGGSDSESP